MSRRLRAHYVSISKCMSQATHIKHHHFYVCHCQKKISWGILKKKTQFLFFSSFIQFSKYMTKHTNMHNWDRLPVTSSRRGHFFSSSGDGKKTMKRENPPEWARKYTQPWHNKHSMGTRSLLRLALKKTTNPLCWMWSSWKTWIFFPHISISFCCTQWWEAGFVGAQPCSYAMGPFIYMFSVHDPSKMFSKQVLGTRAFRLRALWNVLGTPSFRFKIGTHLGLRSMTYCVYTAQRVR